MEYKKQSNQKQFHLKLEKPISPVVIDTQQNDSFSSINGQAYIPRQPTDRFFVDMLKDTQSINTSVKNFYSNLSGEDFSQVIQLSSPLDFRLGNKEKFSLYRLDEEEGEIDKMNMSNSKVF